MTVTKQDEHRRDGTTIRATAPAFLRETFSQLLSLTWLTSRTLRQGFLLLPEPATMRPPAARPPSEPISTKFGIPARSASSIALRTRAESSPASLSPVERHMQRIGRSASSVVHLRGDEAHLLRQLMPRTFEHTGRERVSVVGAPRHNRGQFRKLDARPLVRKRHFSSAWLCKPQWLSMSFSMQVSTPRSCARSADLIASTPIQWPEPSSPSIGPQPPAVCIVPSVQRPTMFDPVPAITSTPGPPWNAASSAISWSTRKVSHRR